MRLTPVSTCAGMYNDNRRRARRILAGCVTVVLESGFGRILQRSRQ
jgi:hypothetical protein